MELQLTADAAPPLSVFYPPSSHPALLKLVDTALPPNPLPVRGFGSGLESGRTTGVRYSRLES